MEQYYHRKGVRICDTSPSLIRPRYIPVLTGGVLDRGGIVISGPVIDPSLESHLTDSFTTGTIFFSL